MPKLYRKHPQTFNLRFSKLQVPAVVVDLTERQRDKADDTGARSPAPSSSIPTVVVDLTKSPRGKASDIQHVFGDLGNLNTVGALEKGLGDFCVPGDFFEQLMVTELPDCDPEAYAPYIFRNERGDDCNTALFNGNVPEKDLRSVPTVKKKQKQKQKKSRTRFLIPSGKPATPAPSKPAAASAEPAGVGWSELTLLDPEDTAAPNLSWVGATEELQDGANGSVHTNHKSNNLSFTFSSLATANTWAKMAFP
jgi:hypothetical protein